MRQYPTGLRLRYQYNSLGFTQRVGTDAGGAIGQVYWSVDSLGGAHPYDAKGNLVRQRFGDPDNAAGAQTFHVHDRAGNQPRRLRVGIAEGNFATQNAELSFDRRTGNLATRFEANTGLRETFQYDDIDRLQVHQLQNTGVAAANRSVSVRYNAIGNILWKSDVGLYSYGAFNQARPHAVSAAAGINYLYDGNGNLSSTTGAATRTHVWTSFNLPQSMSVAGRSTAWAYGAERQRVRVTISRGTLVREQHLLHPDARGGLLFEREVTRNNGTVTQIENRHYITVAGAGVIGVVKTLGENNGAAPATAAGISLAVANQTQYWHKDPLGSIVAVTNARGALVERMAFDAWGRRMQPSGAPDTGTLAAGTLLDPLHGDRGFTGHEMLDELGLVHMNGRIYDPLLGRFFSPDPLVQAPDLLQNFNRYSYALNNPLRYTDPSGEEITTAGWVVLWIAGAVLASEGNQYWRIVGQVMMMYAGYQVGLAGVQEAGITSAGASKAAAAGFSGFASGLVTSGGDVGMALQEGLFAAMTAGVGSTLKGAELVVAHALLGCARGMASGGECGPSALAAAAGKIMTLQISGLTLPDPAELVATTIAGGTAAVIGGGKFANGAAQAAFGYLFNRFTSRGLSGGSCSGSGSSFRCASIIEREGTPQLTGNYKTEWLSVDWDNALSIDFSIPKFPLKFIAVLSVEVASQTGYRVYEFRVTIDTVAVTTENLHVISERLLDTRPSGQTFWAPRPEAPVESTRRQWRTCFLEKIACTK